MVWIKGKILDKGRIVEEQLLRVLQKHEDAIINGATGDSELADKVDALEDRVKALEDAQTPAETPEEPSG